MIKLVNVERYYPVGIGKSYVRERAEMQISAREEALLEAFRRLPSEAVAELSALAQRLAVLAPGTVIDWSDSWSEEDLQEFTAASLKRLRAEEREEPN